MNTFRFLLGASILLTLAAEARPRDGRALERLVPQLMRDAGCRGWRSW